MLMYNEDKVATLFNNHTKKQIEGFSTDEKYYELDDGRYAIVFNDGGAEVFMNFKDMEIFENITGC